MQEQGRGRARGFLRRSHLAAALINTTASGTHIMRRHSQCQCVITINFLAPTLLILFPFLTISTALLTPAAHAVIALAFAQLWRLLIANFVSRLREDSRRFWPCLLLFAAISLLFPLPSLYRLVGAKVALFSIKNSINQLHSGFASPLRC